MYCKRYHEQADKWTSWWMQNRPGGAIRRDAASGLHTAECRYLYASFTC